MASLPRVFSRRVFPILPILLLVALLGSSCSGDGRRPVFPVHGQVFYEGKPTPGALVIFHPLDDPSAPRAVARVDPYGNFAPTTYRTEDGVAAGAYSVTVTWVKETDNQNAPKEEQREPRNLVPDRYSKPETSGLRVQIKEGPNKLDPFRLTLR